MGLKKPAQGQVRVFGIDILKHPEKHLRRIGVQLQETKVFTKLTGRDYLEFFSRLYRHTLPVEDLIRQQDLQEFVDKPLGQVSGGQKQRIILALAIINDPDLIILDEPTIGLDPLARREFWSFIRKLQSSGKTLLFTTHYMDEVQALASQVIVLSRGKVVANGTPEQIIRLHNQSESSSLDDAYEVLVGQTQGAIA
ncbi:ABC transporter ATP-binding protein [Bowmanella dokdonensis]